MRTRFYGKFLLRSWVTKAYKVTHFSIFCFLPCLAFNISQTSSYFALKFFAIIQHPISKFCFKFKPKILKEKNLVSFKNFQRFVAKAKIGYF